jgi:hypothetical protein
MMADTFMDISPSKNVEPDGASDTSRTNASNAPCIDAKYSVEKVRDPFRFERLDFSLNRTSVARVERGTTDRSQRERIAGLLGAPKCCHLLGLDGFKPEIYAAAGIARPHVVTTPAPVSTASR